MEIKRLDARVADKTFRLQHGNRILARIICLGFALDIGKVIHFLTEHLGHKLYTGQIFDFIFTNKLTVPHNGNPVTDFIYLLQEMGYKDNAYALGAKIPHQLKELFNLLLIQG